jgi:hypothetical protein
MNTHLLLGCNSEVGGFLISPLTPSNPQLNTYRTYYFKAHCKNWPSRFISFTLLGRFIFKDDNS